MAIDKLIPRYLNKDNDPKVLKSIELVDALNVRISNDDDGNAGVVKNIKGNTIVGYKNSSLDSLPSGTNKVIGYITNMEKDEVFYFVYNDNNDHSIYKYNVSDDNIVKIYQDKILKFAEYGFVKADIVVNQYGDTILYFTDGINEPKKINASKAERGDYPAEYSQGTSSLPLSGVDRLLFITTAKQPPLDPPTWSFTTEVKRTVNNLYEKTFQFAYQYVYDDGEVSAISPYSTVTNAPNQFLDGFNSDDAKKEFNAIDVSVKTNVGDVKKIRVLARSGIDGVFFIIDEIQNDRSSVKTESIRFYNDGAFSAISRDDQNKLFDNVPQNAESQAISGNRLMYSGYTEGYDNLENIDGELIPNYKKRAASYDIDIAYKLQNDITVKGFNIDFSDLPGTITAGNSITIDIRIENELVKLRATDYPLSWTEWVLNGGQDRISGLIKEDVIVEMTPIKKSFTITASTTKTKQSFITTEVLPKLSESIPLAFDSVDQLSDHATEIRDVERSGGAIGNKRFAFFRGNGTAKISPGLYHQSNNTVYCQVLITSAQLDVETMYGDNLSGNMNTDDPRDIRYRAQNDFALSVDYTGDGSKYQSYADVQQSDASFFNESEGTFVSSFDTPRLTNLSRYLNGIVGTLSFKAGATHSFGVVYYDDRNRSGTVQKLPEVYSKWFGERSNKGETSMVMRLKHNAPSWAKRWSPVYAGNTSVSSFLQYSVIEARTESNASALKSAGQDYDNKLFLSLRSLAGKEDSYVESRGALLDYSFTEGDKLRVLSFGKNYYPDGVEFNVVGYEYYNNSEIDNPLYDNTSVTTQYQTTGYYLILEDNGHPKFGKAAVVGGVDVWDDKCVVEIYSKRKAVDSLPFYEIGKSYEVSGGTHSDDRTQSTGITIDIQGAGSSRFKKFYSEHRVFRGDILECSDPSIRIEIYNVEPSNDSEYTYQGDCKILTNTYDATIQGENDFDVQGSDTVVEIDQGDVYYRLRQLRHGKDITTYNYITDYIEDKSLSDFFPSSQNSFGRSNLYSPNTIQSYRKASITYSEPFNYDNAELKLSSFNLSLANFADFDNSYGAIKYIQNSADSLLCLQENKFSVIPVGRNIIEYSSENSDLVASNNVLGTAKYMAGEYGCNVNPESIATRFGRVYFTDVRAGKVLSFGPSGIEPISEKEMDSFFTKRFADATKYHSKLDINSGYDPDNDEFLVSLGSIHSGLITATHNSTSTSNTFGTDSSGNIVAEPQYASSFFQWENTNLNFDDAFSEFDDAGNGVFYFDRNDIGNLQLDPALFNSNPNANPLNIVVTTTNADPSSATPGPEDFIGLATFDPSNGRVALVDGEGVTFTTSNITERVAGFTAAYDAKGGYWTTLYSYIPEKMGYIKNLFFTFKDGRLYTHETNDNHNTFYGGSVVNSKISIVSNRNPSMVKTYESISIEGSDAWNATFKNTDQQSSVAAGLFEDRERNFYAHIGRDTLSSKNNIISIGKVAANGINGSEVTLTSRISHLPIPRDASIYKVDGSTLVDTTLSVDSISGRKVLKTDGTIGANISDTSGSEDVLVAVSSSVLDGDPMRDYYLQIDLEKASTSAVELYAVNAIFDKSNLHDQQGQ